MHVVSSSDGEIVIKNTQTKLSSSNDKVFDEGADNNEDINPKIKKTLFVCIVLCYMAGHMDLGLFSVATT